MCQRMKYLCKPRNGASGPAIDTETFLSNPNLQEDCIDSLTIVHREKFSRYISGLMDQLGYSYDMIKKRQQVFHDEAYDTNDEIITSVITGSKGEGTTLLLENDFDIMLISLGVICADNPQDFIHERNITLFQAERGEDTPPGYTRLRLIRNGSKFDNVARHCMFTSETGSTYISSQFFIESLSNNLKNESSDHFTPRDPQGPSSRFTGSVEAYCFELDAVSCFKCHCPSILNRWVSRPRSHGWPFSDLIHEVSLKDGHVVPVGSKGSENMYREWRICYTLAELHLIRNFNETQLKVYILSKKICKSVLNPVCKEMTSYIMKNVVFWICEAKGLRLFGHNHLLDRLIDCIQYLRACIIKGNLPSYMIPERNLLARRTDIQQKHRLVAVLGDLLHEGGRMILRCDRICDDMLVMYREPAMFKEFCEKRDQLEVGFLNFYYSKDSIQGLKTEENGDFEFEQLFYEIQLNAISSSIETDEQEEDLISTMLKAILS